MNKINFAFLFLLGSFSFQPSCLGESLVFFLDRRDFSIQPHNACVTFLGEENTATSSCSSMGFNTTSEIDANKVNKLDYLFFFNIPSPSLVKKLINENSIAIVNYTSENKILSTTPLRKISPDDFITIETESIPQLSTQIQQREAEESELKNALSTKTKELEDIFKNLNKDKNIGPELKAFQETQSLESAIKTKDEDIKLLKEKNQLLRSSAQNNGISTIKAQLSTLLKHSIEDALKSPH